jgi:hypothetical protein
MEERAGAQSNWEKFGRGLKRIIPDFLYQVAGSVGAIVDVEDYINSPEEEEIGNWLSDWASGQQEKLKQTDGFQIYNRSNAGMGDIGWWIENGSSLVSSVAGFAVPGMALGKVFNGIRWLDRLTKLAKGGTAISEGGAVAAEAINVGGKGLTWLDRMLDGSNLTRITQGRNVANNLAANLALNQAEGLMEATSVYKDTYDDALTRGVDEESAKRMAGTAAAYTINTNRMNMALNATSVGRFLKSPDAIKSAVKLRSWRVKDILKSPEGVESVWKDALVKEGLQEAGEELVNYYAGEKGRGVLDRILLSGENVSVNENLFNPTKIPDILAGLGTKEGFESAALGFLGGAGQTVLTESFDFIPGKITGERVIKTDEKGKPIYKYKDVSYREATPYERGERVWDEVKLSDGRVLKDGNEYTVQKDAEGNETLNLVSEKYKVTDDDIINNSEILIHKPTELVRNAEGEVIKQNTGEVEYEADGKYFSKVQARKKQWESSQKLNEVIKNTTDKLMNSAQTAQRQAQDWTLIEAVDMLNDPNTNNDQRNTYKDLITRYELFREGKLTGDEVLDKKAIEEKRKEVDNMSTVDLVGKQNQARESLISELAWNSFSTNSTETLLDTFNNIANMSPEKAAEQGYSEDYREKATKSINDINKLKNIFVEYNSKYDPQTAKALFDNRAMDMFLYRDRDRLTSEQNTMVRDVSKKAQERSDRLNTIEGLDQARAINQEEDKELQPHRERLNALNDKIAEIRSRKTQIAGDSMDPMDLINSIERNEEAKRKEINEILAEKDKELAKVRDIRDKYNFKRREYDLLDNADIENIGRYDLLLQRQRERITNNDQLFIELRDRIRVNKVKQQAINFQRLKELRFIDFMETILSLQAKGTHSPVFRVDETFTEEDEHAKVLFSMLYERYKLLVESKKTTPGEINVLSDNPPITSATERSTKLQEARDANNATLVASLERQYNLEDILYQKETTLSSQIAARMALGDDSITYSENLINEVKDAIKNLVQDKKQPRTELEKKVQSLYNNSVKEDDQAVGSRPEKTTPTSPIKDFEKDIEEIIQQYTKLFNEFMTERFNSMKPRVISKLKNKLKRSQKLSETQLFIEELLTSGLNGKISKEEQDGKTTYYFIPELQSGMYIDESEKNFYEFATYPESKDKIYDVKPTNTPGYYTVTVKDPEYKVQMTVDNSKQIEVYSKEQIEYKDNLENALKIIRNQANRLKQLRREKSKALADVNDSSNSILVGLNNLKELFEQRIPGFKEFISALERGDVDPEEKAKIKEIELAEKRAEIESRREEELERLRTDPSYEDEGGPEALDGYLFSESGLSFEDYRSIRINARYDAELDMVGTEPEEAPEKREPSGLYSDILKFFDVLPKSVIDAKKTHLETQLNDLNLAKNVLDLELQNNAEKVRNLINNKKKVEDALNAEDKVKLKTALIQQLEEIQNTMSSIKATNISLKKKKSRIVSKINETDKALKNYKILSELALNNKLTVSELRADLKDYNNDLLKTKEALVNSIDKNEQLLAELKELRKFYNSFIKEKTGDLDKINQALDSQTDELAKLGYELDDDTAKRIKRDYYLDSAYKSFYEEFQMLLNSKRLTKSQYNSTISRIADVINQLETYGDEDDQLINHFRRLHVKLTEIASKPDSKIRTKFTKEFKALFPKYKDGEFKKMVAESISYFQESVDNIYVADAVLENISKLNTAKNNAIGSVNEIKDLVVYKANGLVTPDLELGKVTSITKLNKIISSLSKKLSEQSAEHKILTDKYSAISKDVDAFFNTYVYKDMLEYRKSLKSSINTFKKEIEKTSGAIIDSLVTTKAI